MNRTRISPIKAAKFQWNAVKEDSNILERVWFTLTAIKELSIVGIPEKEIGLVRAYAKQRGMPSPM